MTGALKKITNLVILLVTGNVLRVEASSVTLANNEVASVGLIPIYGELASAEVLGFHHGLIFGPVLVSVWTAALPGNNMCGLLVFLNGFKSSKHER